MTNTNTPAWPTDLLISEITMVQEMRNLIHRHRMVLLNLQQNARTTEDTEDAENGLTALAHLETEVGQYVDNAAG